MGEPKGQRLPHDEAPREWLEWGLMEAAKKGVDVSAALIYDWWEEFHDYWVGVPGQRGRKLDWAATWRNRVRERIEREADKRRREASWSGGRQQPGIGIGIAAAARARDRQRGH